MGAGLGQAAAALDGPVGLIIALSLGTAGVIIHAIRPAALRFETSTR